MKGETESSFCVQKSFSKSSVLISGATGFVGKVLVEKLLRDVAGINKIFILIRGKRGKSVEERMKLYKESEVFRRIRAECPEAFDKLVPIEAEITNADNFGLSETTCELLAKEVNIVFHMAATVKFDEPVDVAVRTNLIATKTIVDISKSFKNLKAFLYVSTAFSNVHVSHEIEEKIYESNFEWRKVTEIVKNGDVNKLEKLSFEVTKYFPNTYTFSKNLSEKLISEYSTEFPMIILRPSVIVQTYAEPFPGWVDFRGTVIGFQMGINYGLLRHIFVDPATELNLIHCDYVASSAIAAVAKSVYDDDKNLKIYNCTLKSGMRTFGDYKKLLLETAREVAPTSNALIYPNFKYHQNFFNFLANVLIFQMIPAVMIDLIMWIPKRSFTFTKIIHQIIKAARDFEFFTFNKIKFSNRKFIELYQALNEKDR